MHKKRLQRRAFCYWLSALIGKHVVIITNLITLNTICQIRGWIYLQHTRIAVALVRANFLLLFD